MCLYVERDFKTKKEAIAFSKKPLIAKEDITVYKILDRGFFSPYRDFKYKRGEEYKATFSFFVTSISHDLEVHSGLHAYVSMEYAYGNRSDEQKIYKMTIPKGAKYFVGIFNEIVSNRLIFK